METILSQNQALVLDKANSLFQVRLVQGTTLINDVYVLQKNLVEWISVNIPKIATQTGSSTVTASAILAFNSVINMPASPITLPAASTAVATSATTVGFANATPTTATSPTSASPTSTQSMGDSLF